MYIPRILQSVGLQLYSYGLG